VTLDPIQEEFVEVNGVRLRALVEGAPCRGAESVLILHGFTGSAESMVGTSGPLARERHVVRLELVGHGASDAPESLAPYTMEACVEQIVSVSAALNLGTPHLVGYSMGGRAALSSAIAHPRAFASLVLVGATAGIADRDLRRERIAADIALAERIERDGIEAFVEDWMGLPLFASQSRLGSVALSRAREQRIRNRVVGLANSLRGMGAGAQPPLHDRLDRYTRPVLLVVGAEDSKFRAIASTLASKLPDAQTQTLPEAGHAAHLEAPEHFSTVVKEFLGAVEAERAGVDPGGLLESSRVEENEHE
jgi:2-succinyl-6-hydroxy-2,4-cyclohexadiene-1-carboxylate synthase